MPSQPSKQVPDASDNVVMDVPGTSPVTSRTTNASQSRSLASSTNASFGRESSHNATIERFVERARQQFEDLIWSLDPSELRDIASAIEQNSHHRLSRKRQRTSDADAEVDTPIRSPSTDQGERDSESGVQESEAAICIRCFRNWAKAIDAKTDILECVTEKPKRKKCEACSGKRISCEYIPYDGAKTLRRLKSSMDQAPDVKKLSARRKFEREYWRLSDYIYDHPIPAETERKAKQRAHKRTQRRAISHAENEEQQGGDLAIRSREQSIDDGGEEDDLAVEAQIRQETQGTL